MKRFVEEYLHFRIPHVGPDLELPRKYNLRRYEASRLEKTYLFGKKKSTFDVVDFNSELLPARTSATGWFFEMHSPSVI